MPPGSSVWGIIQFSVDDSEEQAFFQCDQQCRVKKSVRKLLKIESVVSFDAVKARRKLYGCEWTCRAIHSCSESNDFETQSEGCTSHNTYNHVATKINSSRMHGSLASNDRLSQRYSLPEVCNKECCVTHVSGTGVGLKLFTLAFALHQICYLFGIPLAGIDLQQVLREGNFQYLRHI